MAALFKRYKTKRKNQSGKLLYIRTIFIVLIVALGLFGASYASWTQQFNILSAISTGSLNVDIVDAVLESSDSHKSISFSAHKEGNVVDEVDMNVVTASNPFSAVMVFAVENNGTIPVICVGIDQSVPDNLEVEILESPPLIDVGETESVKVRITKGYCDDFEFSAFLEFEQYNAVN